MSRATRIHTYTNGVLSERSIRWHSTALRDTTRDGRALQTALVSRHASRRVASQNTETLQIRRSQGVASDPRACRVLRVCRLRHGTGPVWVRALRSRARPRGVLPICADLRARFPGGPSACTPRRSRPRAPASARWPPLRHCAENAHTRNFHINAKILQGQDSCGAPSIYIWGQMRTCLSHAPKSSWALGQHGKWLQDSCEINLTPKERRYVTCEILHVMCCYAIQYAIYDGWSLPLW